MAYGILNISFLWKWKKNLFFKVVHNIIFKINFKS